jgi:nitroreductase
MTVTEAVNVRRSVRAFLPTPVPLPVLRTLVNQSSRAPSGANLQPWHVYALTGAPLDELKGIVKDNLTRGEREAGEYSIFPSELWEPLLSRRRESGAQRYAALGLGRSEAALASLEQMNFEFFGAPVGLFFCLDRRVGPPQWADVGMYMQTFMLLAVEQGLATCPQEIWSVWPRTVARFIGMPDELMLFAGMSLGYEDAHSPMNSYRTERAPLESFASFLGFN